MPMTHAAALRLYKRATETHQRKDWRMACHALAAIVEALDGRESAPKPAPRIKPETTLIEFLSVKGIRDEGGELRRLDGELWHKARPFRRRLVRDDGRSLESAAQAAWEAGYFPDVPAPSMDGDDNMQPVSGDDLVEAIARELAREAGHDSPPDFDDDRWHAIEDFERDQLEAV